MQLIAEGLNFPTSVAIGPDGAVFVAESGLPFGGAPPGGVISKVRDAGRLQRVADNLRFPVNGLTWHEGALIVSEGGNPGRISRIDPESGERTTILEGLPGFGNYHTNMVAVGPEGKLYFSQGAMTNSGVIGLDSHDLAWLREVPHNCDIPGYDIELAGFEGETADPRSSGGGSVRTGAFAPFGTSAADRHIAGRVPCTASVMRCDPDGRNLELVAWGLRNAYGLGFLPDGRLVATDQGADMRGSRPVPNCPDFLYEVRQGAWYGWPDFFGGRQLTGFVLANHHALPAPELPLIGFEPNCCAVKFAVVPKGMEYAGELILAMFGDEKPMTAPAGLPAGRRLVRVSPHDWSVHPVSAAPLNRPIDVAFDSLRREGYIVDFGEFEINPDKRVRATAASGRLWSFHPTTGEAKRG